MTRDDIIRMAREAGMVWASGLSGAGYHISHPANLERFARAAFAAGAATEREECAKVCQQQVTGCDAAADLARLACAAAIRARGSQ